MNKVFIVLLGLSAACLSIGQPRGNMPDRGLMSDQGLGAPTAAPVR